MEYTEEQETAFKQQFAERRRRQIVVAGPAFVVLVISALAFSLWNWRCPACNRYLGKGARPRFCAKCGAPLQ